MSKHFLSALFAGMAIGLLPGPSHAQDPPATGVTTVCGLPVPAPAALPPVDLGPVLYQIVPCFERQGNVSSVEPATYLYYIHLARSVSLPSQNKWTPYDEGIENAIRDDFKRLWATNFLDNLSIEAEDYVFSNGVVGKMVVYHLTERERIRNVEYNGSKRLERTKITEKLQELNIDPRTDSFVDPANIRRVESVLRSFMAEKGYPNAEVSHTITPVAGGPKLVNIVFDVKDGPKIKIRDVEFVGNSAISDGALERRIKVNKPKGLMFFMNSRGTYKAEKFEEDADRVQQHYRNQGYIQARVGAPELKVLEDSQDGETRWVQLRIPVTEGQRFRLGEFGFDGNTVLRSEVLRPLFDVKPGEFYNEEAIRKGLEKAREVYGAGGYWEFTGFPDQKPRDTGVGNAPGQVPLALAAEVPPAEPIVDVVMRLQEGKQYFINKITFVGNTTTRDNVIRRELQLAEGGVFNTESLKYSVRRLNQLGYFKPLEEQTAIKVDKTAGREGTVDLTLKFEEQNRNQITFGAGVSQFEGFFGQLSFQTSNFLGRGESLTVSMQAGSRAQNYQLAFSEPFLFDRNITGGFDLYKRTIHYISQFTQDATGGNLMFGFPVADFSRLFATYSYEEVAVQDLNEAFFDSTCLYLERGCSEVALNNLSSSQLLLIQRNPFLYDSLLIGQSGKRTVSKIAPSFVHNTVDNPIFPNTGKRLTLSLDMAGIGGNTKYYKPRAEGIWFMRHTSRTSLGVRGKIEYISPLTGSTLPIFEKLYLGGEYDIRGYDIRTIGPSDPRNPGLVLGGNKSLLVNAEYLISIAGPVRLILFYDAGQVRDIGDRFSWKETLLGVDRPVRLTDPLATVALVDPNTAALPLKVLGTTSSFKTSTGAEVRFFMPVLNVPFRLIFAANPQRGGVLDNNLRPAKDFTFKFAVGSTF